MGVRLRRRERSDSRSSPSASRGRRRHVVRDRRAVWQPRKWPSWRHHLDMTGEQIARHLGVSKILQVSRWETAGNRLGQVPDRLLRTLVLLQIGRARPDLGLFRTAGLNREAVVTSFR